MSNDKHKNIPVFLIESDIGYALAACGGQPSSGTPTGVQPSSVLIWSGCFAGLSGIIVGNRPGILPNDTSRDWFHQIKLFRKVFLALRARAASTGGGDCANHELMASIIEYRKL